ncbi:MAG: BON domain-containing protein [Deltaproteobacteria bacterium]|nr:BON domain-containing protein [Deltaproteobacteria bacterium]
MNKELLDSMTGLLRCQRKTYLEEFRKAEKDLESIAEERESELEEHAQEEQSARLLTRLDNRTLEAVREIDAALERILKGAYGKCERCRNAISIARLRALPATRFCKRCAGRSERRPVAASGAPETVTAVSVPPDLSLLDDRELAEAILEHLKEDGRIDMEELRVLTRKGVVYLTGALPSEAEHQILLQTLTDVLGFKEIVDHIEIEELLWENDRRTREKPPEEQPSWEDSAGTEDVVESHEEGKEFVAPAKPTPEEQ